MRIFATMLGFNHADMIEGALENFENTTTDAEHRRLVKTLFLLQYPIPNVEQNRADLLRLGAKYGWWTTEMPNGPIMENHNRAIHDYYRMREGDFYIVFDPDVRMRNPGWVSAMVDALRSDPNAVFCCAARGFHDDEWCWKQHGRTITTLPSGVRISRYRQLIAWSMGMWKGEWLAARPRDFKAPNAIYGYLEHADLALMERHNKTWLQTTDFYDDHVGATNPQYTEWKIQSAGGKTKAHFAEWLRATR